MTYAEAAAIKTLTATEGQTLWATFRTHLDANNPDIVAMGHRGDINAMIMEAPHVVERGRDVMGLFPVDETDGHDLIWIALSLEHRGCCMGQEARESFEELAEYRFSDLKS